ncbi:hypothetical protein C0991_008763 [Blastosporella zonata]|nr:hypothetical protein C0991_008763 [Blastosporella zonata]
MAAQTPEQQKQEYSRQLAAYTFQQWKAVKPTNIPSEKNGEKADRRAGHERGRKEAALKVDNRVQDNNGSDRASRGVERQKPRG